MHRQLDEKTFVDGQIAPGDMAELKALGITMIINNRPDGEDVGQPTSEEIEAAARAEGLDYRHVPIVRGMGPSDIEAMRDAIHATGDGKLFAFCRSGNRSTLAWAVARNEDGTPREELERCADGAGFSLDPIVHLLRD
ncbi:MAG: TIGR01244 family sulfur transferase [Sphingomicrobium sp.]